MVDANDDSDMAPDAPHGGRVEGTFRASGQDTIRRSHWMVDKSWRALPKVRHVRVEDRASGLKAEQEEVSCFDGAGQPHLLIAQLTELPRHAHRMLGNGRTHAVKPPKARAFAAPAAGPRSPRGSLWIECPSRKQTSDWQSGSNAPGRRYDRPRRKRSCENPPNALLMRQSDLTKTAQTCADTRQAGWSAFTEE